MAKPVVPIVKPLTRDEELLRLYNELNPDADLTPTTAPGTATRAPGSAPAPKLGGAGAEPDADSPLLLGVQRTSGDPELDSKFSDIGRVRLRDELYTDIDKEWKERQSFEKRKGEDPVGQVLGSLTPEELKATPDIVRAIAKGVSPAVKPRAPYFGGEDPKEKVWHIPNVGMKAIQVWGDTHPEMGISKLETSEQVKIGYKKGVISPLSSEEDHYKYIDDVFSAKSKISGITKAIAESHAKYIAGALGRTADEPINIVIDTKTGQPRWNISKIKSDLLFSNIDSKLSEAGYGGLLIAPDMIAHEKGYPDYWGAPQDVRDSINATIKAYTARSDTWAEQEILRYMNLTSNTGLTIVDTDPDASNIELAKEPVIGVSGFPLPGGGKLILPIPVQDIKAIFSPTTAKITYNKDYGDYSIPASEFDPEHAGEYFFRTVFDAIPAAMVARKRQLDELGVNDDLMSDATPIVLPGMENPIWSITSPWAPGYQSAVDKIVNVIGNDLPEAERIKYIESVRKDPMWAHYMSEQFVAAADAGSVAGLTPEQASRAAIAGGAFGFFTGDMVAPDLFSLGLAGAGGAIKAFDPGVIGRYEKAVDVAHQYVDTESYSKLQDRMIRVRPEIALHAEMYIASKSNVPEVVRDQISLRVRAAQNAKSRLDEALAAVKATPDNIEAKAAVAKAEYESAKAERELLEFKIEGLRDQIADTEKYHGQRQDTIDAANRAYQEELDRSNNLEALRAKTYADNEPAIKQYEADIADYRTKGAIVAKIDNNLKASIQEKKARVLQAQADETKAREDIIDAIDAKDNVARDKATDNLRDALIEQNLMKNKDSALNRKIKDLRLRKEGAIKKLGEAKVAFDKTHVAHGQVYVDYAKITSRMDRATSNMNNYRWALNVLGVAPGEVTDIARLREALRFNLELYEQEYKAIGTKYNFKDLKTTARRLRKTVQIKDREAALKDRAENWRKYYKEFIDLVDDGRLDYLPPPVNAKRLIDHVLPTEIKLKAASSPEHIAIRPEEFIANLYATYGFDAVNMLLREHGRVNDIVRTIKATADKGGTLYQAPIPDISHLNIELAHYLEHARYRSDPNYIPRQMVEALELSRKWDSTLKPVGLIEALTKRARLIAAAYDPLRAHHGDLSPDAIQTIKVVVNGSHQVQDELIAIGNKAAYDSLRADIKAQIDTVLGLNPTTAPGTGKDAAMIGSIVQYMDTHTHVPYKGNYAFMNATDPATLWQRGRSQLVNSDLLIKDREALKAWLDAEGGGSSIVPISDTTKLPDIEYSRRAESIEEIKQANEAERIQSSKPWIEYSKIVDDISKEPDLEVRKTKLKMNAGRMLDLLGGNQYSGAIADIAIKEMVQNSFDAIKAEVYHSKIKKGLIIVDINNTDRTISISDNGSGMSPEIIDRALFTVAEPGKGDLPVHLRSRGLGMAKIAFLQGSEWVEVVSTRDGIQSYVRVTADQIRNGEIDIVPSRVGKETPNGTTITVKIPETYYDSNTAQNVNIDFPDYGTPSFLSKPFIGPVEVVLRRPYEAEEIVSKGTTDIPLFTKIKFSWGNADLYVGTEINKYPKHSILSSGIYQFNKQIGGWNDPFPYDVIVDIKPNVDPIHAHYPFTNNRQDFRATVEEDVKALTEYLKNHQKGLEAKSTSDIFASAVSMDRVSLEAVGGDIESARAAILAQFNKERNIAQSAASEIPDELYISGDTVKDKKGNTLVKVKTQSERYAEKSFRAEKEGQAAADFFNKLSFDPKKPLFHNNTNVDYVQYGRSIGKKPEEFFTLLGSVVTEFRERLGKNPPAYGYEKLDAAESPYASGISVDKKYKGVHIRVPYKAFFINPLAHGGNTPVGVAESMLHTLIHEATHTVVSKHEEDFTIALGVLYEKLGDTGDIYAFRTALEKSISQHWDTFVALRNKYNEFRTTNVASHLQDKSEQAARSSAEFSKVSSTGSSGVTATGRGKGNIPPGNTVTGSTGAGKPVDPSGGRAEIPVPKGLIKDENNLLRALAWAWAPSSFTGLPDSAMARIYYQAGQVLLENHKANGTFLDFMMKMRDITRSEFATAEWHKSRAFSFAAVGVAHSALMETAMHTLHRAMGGGLTDVQIADMIKLMHGEYNQIQDISGAMSGFARMGTPISMRKVVDAEGNKIPIAVFKAGNISGSDIILTTPILRGIEAQMPDVIKAVDARNIVPRDPAAMFSPLRVQDWLEAAWKRTAVTGAIIPKTAFGIMQFLGNFGQMWFSAGLGVARRVSFNTLPDFIPFAERLNNIGSRIARATMGKPVLGTITNSLFNPLLGDVWLGKQGWFRTKSGSILTYDDARKMLVEDGILDTFINEEITNVYARKTPNVTSLIRRWPRMISEMFNHIEQRQRSALYLDMLINGASRHEARRMTLEALYDWRSTFAKKELSLVFRMIPFARYFTLAARQSLLGITEPFTKPGETALKAMFGQSKTGYVRAQIHLKDYISDTFLYSQPELQEPAEDINEEHEELSNFIRPGYHTDRGIIGTYKNSDDKVRALKTITDREYPYGVYVLPQMTNTDMYAMGFTILSGLTALTLPDEYTTPDWGRATYTSLSGLFFPHVREALDAVYAKYSGDPASMSYGNDAEPTAAEAAMIRGFNKVGTWALWRNKDGVLRTDAANVKSLRMMPGLGTEILPFMNDVYFRNPEFIRLEQEVHKFQSMKLELEGTTDPDKRNELLESMNKIRASSHSMAYDGLFRTFMGMTNMEYYYDPMHEIDRRGIIQQKYLQDLGKTEPIRPEPKYIGGEGSDIVRE